MATEIKCNDGSQLIITTDHPASSYGVPVMLVGDDAFGPLDEFPTALEGSVASDLLPAPWRLSESQKTAVDLFLSVSIVAQQRRAAQWAN